MLNFTFEIRDMGAPAQGETWTDVLVRQGRLLGYETAG